MIVAIPQSTGTAAAHARMQVASAMDTLPRCRSCAPFLVRLRCICAPMLPRDAIGRPEGSALHEASLSRVGGSASGFELG